MTNSEKEKIKRFADSLVIKATEQAENQLDSATQAANEQMISDMRDIDCKMAQSVQTQIKNIEAEAVKSRENRRVELRRKMFLLEQRLTDGVVEIVESKLEKFVQTQEYRDFLCEKCKSVLGQHKINFTVYLSAFDMQYSIDILKTLAQSPDAAARLEGIESDSDIHHGGVRFVSLSSGVALDMTFDTLLNDSRAQIYDMAGRAMAELEENNIEETKA